MRLSLFFFLCIVCNITYAQNIRFKSIQFGPTLAIQTDRPDTTIAEIRKLVKNPQSFPKNSLDTLERDPGNGIFFGSVTGIQVALLTTWEINSKKKGKLGLQKEWRIGIEYSYLGNSQEEWSSVDHTASPVSVDQVYFRRQNHFMGLYTDFIFKKGVSRNRLSFYGGAGGYLSYSFSGRIVEKLARGVYLTNTSFEKFHHATEPRRDIAVLFPMGIEMRSANPQRPLGVSLGIRPGFMIVKEKNLDSFMPGMMGFTARMVYSLY